MRTSSFPGDVEDALLDLRFNMLPGGGSGVLTFRPVSGYGDRAFAVYVNGRRAARVHAADGQPARAGLVLPPESGDAALFVEDLGDWSDELYDPDFGALDAESGSADRISLAWLAPVELHPRGNAAALSQLSAWSLTGIKRFSNCAPLPGVSTRAQLDIRLAVAGALRTVSIYSGAALVAEGSRSGDGSVSLSAQNDSGISGSVSVAAAGGIAAGEYALELRFPQSYEIHYDTSVLNFPRAAQLSVVDDGRSNKFRALSPALPAGAYYAAIVSVSDTGVKRTSAAAEQIELLDVPEPPQDLAYDSGAAAATVIRWTASATPGATYRIYDSAIDAVTILETPADTHAAGSGTIQHTLGAITGFPGTRRVIVRAVNAGVEEQNCMILKIEYDAAGNVIGARPNAPRIRSVSVSAGRQVTVRAAYFAFDQAAAPADAQLFLVAENSAIDYDTPVDTQAWSEDVAGIRVVTLSATAPSDGYFKIAVRARSAAQIHDTGTAWERVHVSNTEPGAVSDFEAAAARS